MKLELKLYDDQNSFETKEIQFQIEKKEECPNFNDKFSSWEININKEIVDTYRYTFPEMNEGIKIISVKIGISGMNYNPDTSTLEIK